MKQYETSDNPGMYIYEETTHSKTNAHSSLDKIGQSLPMEAYTNVKLRGNK